MRRSHADAHAACAGLQPITSTTSSKYFVNGCCFCRKHARVCPGEGNGFLFESPFRTGGEETWLLQDYRASFNGRGGGGCINPDLYLKSLQEAAKLFSIRDDAIGNQTGAFLAPQLLPVAKGWLCSGGNMRRSLPATEGGFGCRTGWFFASFTLDQVQRGEFIGRA